MKEPTKRLAVFAHWDRDRLIDPYVVHYLQELSKLCDIVFVSDCHLSAEELEKVKPHTIAHLAEPHGEYDFGSYKRGYLHAAGHLNDYDELVFVNDSCFGPLKPLERIWNTMDSKDCDFWGMFEHFDPRIREWHLQSYFLVLKRKVFRSQVFDAFIRKVQCEKMKDDVIIKYEVGLSVALKHAGFRAASLCPRSDVNHTHLIGAFDLIEEHDMPLIKKALLYKNPLRAPYLIDGAVRLEASMGSGTPWNLAQAHLERLNGRNYLNHWFHGDLIQWTFIHPKILRFKEKPLRWMNILSIKIGGITVGAIPWKINFRRIAYDRSRHSPS